MEQFTDEHANLLLGKEFLVKVDAASSTPYLIKYCATPTYCCILITDMKRTWAEVLTRKELARRWRDCNRQNAPENPDFDHEEAWRTNIFDLLTKAHTLGGFADMLFEAVESNFSDLAFELNYESFKWRWEVSFLGYKISADILSKHLIVPLISANHLAFSSADPVSELSDIDLEQAVDKMGRVAKRSPDVHIRNALAKPRVATTVRRVASVLYSIPDIPNICSEMDRSSLVVPPTEKAASISTDIRFASPDLLAPKATASPAPVSRSASPVSRLSKNVDMRRESPIPPVKVPDRQIMMDSATESDEDPAPTHKGKEKIMPISPSPPAGSVEAPGEASRKASPSSVGQNQNKGSPSDSDSSPVRPVKKKQKQISSSDGNSDEERPAVSRGGAPAKRGTRQPIKRGGKRF